MRAKANALRAAALLALAGLCLAAAAVFDLFGVNYLRWWISAGPLIGIATAAIGAAWGAIDKNPGLVSADPLDYLGSSMQMVGLPIQVFGVHLDRLDAAGPLDRVLLYPMALVYVLAMLGWLLLIAPPQYFAFLLFGAPSRLALASDRRVFARFDGPRVDVEPVDDPHAEPNRKGGWWDASMREKPVTMAGAFMAGGLFLFDAAAPAFGRAQAALT